MNQREIWDQNADAWKELGVCLEDRTAIREFLHDDGFYEMHDDPKTADDNKRSPRDNKPDVLDIGVGTESHLDRDLVNAVALDLSSKMLMYNHSDKRVQASAVNLPVPEDSFDRALSTFVMRYLSVDEQKQAIREMIRAVRPGGGVYVIDYRRIGGDSEVAPFDPVMLMKRVGIERGTEQGRYATGVIGIIGSGFAANYNVQVLRILV